MRRCGTVMGLFGLLMMIAVAEGFGSDMISIVWFALGELCAISFIWLGAKLTQK